MSLFHLWKFHSMALIAGCILDWLMGDPYWLFHPVRFMGNMISALEARLRRLFPEHLLLAGGVLAGFMCLFWTLIPVLGFLGIYRGLLSFGIQRHWIYICLFVLESFFCGQLLAARSLQTESMKVCSALKEGDIEKARKAVSMIVGRDTAVLDRDGIARAAVETVAENTSDGVIAPFFFMAVFGPAGGFFYKAVNTMDSMVGYKNETYLLFGRAAAKLDDTVNWLPARLSGMLLTAAAWLLPGMMGKMPGESLNGTVLTMPAPIPPRERRPVPELFICVWPGTPGTLELFIKSLISAMMTGLSVQTTSKESAALCLELRDF